MESAIVAGDSDTWTDSLPGYSAADGYSVRYVLSRGGEKHEFAATGSGTTWTVNVASADSAKLAPGRWSFAILATLDGARTTVASGTFLVYPDPQGSDPFAGLREEIALAEAALRKRLKGEAVESFSLRGQSVTMMPIDALKRFINVLKSELRQRQALSAGHNTTFTGQIKFV